MIAWSRGPQEMRIVKFDGEEGWERSVRFPLSQETSASSPARVPGAATRET